MRTEPAENWRRLITTTGSSSARLAAWDALDLKAMAAIDESTGGQPVLQSHTVPAEGHRRVHPTPGEIIKQVGEIDRTEEAFNALSAAGPIAYSSGCLGEPGDVLQSRWKASWSVRQ
jgi:hypothetical protein